MKRALWIIVLAAWTMTSMGAQQITGTISGLILDATGSGIPNAAVTVTNTDRNAVIRTATTDSSGNYVAPLLPIGHYSVMAEAPGFKKVAKASIELNVNDDLKIDLTLQVGDVTSEVTVVENADQVELQTAVSSTLIDGNQIRDLSLNARNYEQLVALMPGVTFTGTGDQIYVGSQNPLTGQSNAVTFSINGGRTDQNSWTIDGADNVDRGANLTLLSYPSVDAIEEFRVVRGQYSAEFGRNASGTVNVVTRSGTKNLHVGAYEFFRNDKLAANNFFNNKNGVNPGPDGKARVPPLRYNNFGYNIGGPVYIPGLYEQKNKTFFFFSEEFRRAITYASVLGTAPTADEKRGVFTAPVCIAVSGATCTDSSTTVPISPLAQAYIKDIYSKVPDANSGHAINLALRNVTNFREELLKMDHVFSPKWSLQGRFVNDSIPTIEPRGLFTGAALPGVSDTRTNSPGKGFNFRVTGTLSQTMVNEAGYSYSYGAIVSDPTGLDASINSPDINVKLPFAVTLGRIPTLNFSGTMSTVTGFGPYRDYNRNHNWFDNLTKIKGAHTFKMGVSLNHYQKFENAAGNNVGSFTFATTPRPTGSAATTTMQAWANFLLGNFSTFTQVARDITPDIRANQVEMYFQDDYRARRNLTVNMGVRYGLYRQPYDANGFLNAFDPKFYDPAKAPQVDASGNLVAGTGDPLNGFIIGGKNSPWGNKIAPENYLDFAPRIGFTWDPFKKGKMAIRGGYGIVHDVPAIGRYEDPITTNPASVQSITILNSNVSNVTGGTVSVPTSPPAITSIGTNYQTPYLQQYSLNIQHLLPLRILVDIGYVGSKATHQWGEPDINQLQPGQAVALGITDANTPLVTSNDPRVNAYRPFRGYRAINMYQTWFDSRYSSLQTMVRKNFAKGGFITGSYTWSKTLTNAGSNGATPQNFYNRTVERGHSPYDRNHVLTATWSYELPFFRQSSGILKYALSGWQPSVILSAASGLWSFNPSSSSLGTDPAGLGILGAGSGATPRADFVCDPNENAPHTIAQWFNTTCMQDVPKGSIRPGNAPRNGIRGPGYQKWDISIFKNFKFTEQMKAQFRLETYNTFNHTNWSSISATLGSTTFGQITAARDPRIVQLGLKLNY